MSHSDSSSASLLPLSRPPPVRASVSSSAAYSCMTALYASLAVFVAHFIFSVFRMSAMQFSQATVTLPGLFSGSCFLTASRSAMRFSRSFRSHWVHAGAPSGAWGAGAAGAAGAGGARAWPRPRPAPPLFRSFSRAMSKRCPKLFKRAARRPKDDVQTSFGRPPNTMMKFTLDVECPKQHPKQHPKKLNLSIVEVGTDFSMGSSFREVDVRRV